MRGPSTQLGAVVGEWWPPAQEAGQAEGSEVHYHDWAGLITCTDLATEGAVQARLKVGLLTALLQCAAPPGDPRNAQSNAKHACKRATDDHLQLKDTFSQPLARREDHQRHSAVPDTQHSSPSHGCFRLPTGTLLHLETL